MEHSGHLHLIGKMHDVGSILSKSFSLISKHFSAILGYNALKEVFPGIALLPLQYGQSTFPSILFFIVPFQDNPQILQSQTPENV